MQVTFEVPDELAVLFGADSASLSKAALEALLLEGLRAQKLSIASARHLLEIPSRYEMDGCLKAHDILLDFTIDEVLRDAAAANGFSKS